MNTTSTIMRIRFVSDNVAKMTDGQRQESRDLLKSVWNDFSPELRKHDIAAKYGFNEWMFFLPKTDQEGASRFAKQFREHLLELLQPRPQLFSKSPVVIGTSSVPRDSKKAGMKVERQFRQLVDETYQAVEYCQGHPSVCIADYDEVLSAPKGLQSTARPAMNQNYDDN